MAEHAATTVRGVWHLWHEGGAQWGTSLSVLDGWWIEGHIEGVTGWSIGPHPINGSQQDGTPSQDVQDLYHKLRTVIVPVFYGDRGKWTEVMRHAIAFNASFFNTHRMVQQYAANAYV